jgi:hypothetical protein
MPPKAEDELEAEAKFNAEYERGYADGADLSRQMRAVKSGESAAYRTGFDDGFNEN